MEIPKEMTLKNVSVKELADVLYEKLQESKEDCTAPLSIESLRALGHTLLCSYVTVQRQRNAHLPIYRLFPEILSIIFRYYVPRSKTNTIFWETGCFNTSELVRLTHVCHLWRSVALSIPSLWCSIDDLSLGLSTYLERSRGAPLSVTTTRNPKHNSLLHNLLTYPQSRRVCELYLIGAEVPGVFSIPKFNLPHLVFLTISGPQDYRGDDITIPSSDDAPRLRRLNLRNLGWLPSNKYPALTHLSLSNIHPRNHESVLDILSLLSGTPNLQDLFLRSFSYCEYCGDAIHGISLKYLRRITFEDTSASYISLLLRHLDLAVETMIQYISHSVWPADPAYVLTQITGAPLRLTMKDADYRCPSHETFRSENDFLITSVGALYRAHYIVIVPTGSIEFLGNWLGSLPCSSIQELCIGACKATSFPTLFLTAAVSKSACSNLETLVVSDRRLGESLLLFNSSLGFHINWTIDSAFPRLTTLRVVWRRACAGFDLLVGTDDLALLREVHREMRFPFKRLVIESTSWRPGMIDQLSQEVVNLFNSVECKSFDETSSMELPYD